MLRREENERRWKGMYAFEHKARFYEKRHNLKADRLIVISPTVDNKARQVAERLGIEVYSFAEDAGKELLEKNDT